MVIAVDDYGCAYIGCSTSSTDFPVTSGAYDVVYDRDPADTNPSSCIAAISKLNAQGTSLEYSTYLGGTYYTVIKDIAVDPYGYLYFTGWAQIRDFPSTPGAISNSGKYWDFDTFVGKIGPLGDNLEYLASFGGSDTSDFPQGIAIDSEGCAFITGYTSSTDFPITSGAYQSTHRGLNDCFVTKINPTGTMLIYLTFLGGTSDEGYLSKIKVDNEDCAYVSGYTKSTDFPTTSGSYDETYSGGTYDGYITKLNPSGTGLEFSTFLGGSLEDTISDIALDSEKNIYIVGRSKSLDFPVTPGVYDEIHDQYDDGFIAELDPTGSSLILSTVYGGNYGIYPRSIARDADGYIYVAGQFGYGPTPDAFCKVLYWAVGDGYLYNMGSIAKFDPSLTKLVYWTYFGGGEYQDLTDMAIDNNDSIYVAGQTYSDGLSVTPGAFDTTFNGGTSGDAFVAKFDIKHASVKPDVWIRPLTVPTYVGMNVYEDTPNTQICSQTVKVNKTVVYYAMVENDSTIPGYIGVKGSALPDGWTLKYTDANGVDITADMLAGLYLTPELGPGKRHQIIIYVKPLAGATGDGNITLTASSVGTSFMKDSAAFNAVFDPAKPDIWLRPSTNNTYIGMNVYESTPDTQVCSQASSNKTLVYYARIENDGPISGKFTVIGSDAPAGWSVKYLDSASADITSGVVAGTYETASLAPGTNTLVTIYLKPLLNAPAGDVNIELTATNASSPANSDSCRFTALSQSGKPDMWIRALPDAAYVGMNLYEASPVTQNCGQSLSMNKTGIYYAWIENDGFTPAKFTVTGTSLPAGWDLKYRDVAGLDITSAVLAGTYQTAELAPGKKHQVTIYIKPLSAALGDASITLTASTQDGTVVPDSGLFTVHGL
ncbi:MAG: SBBP repeat-containing protein [Armatimonadota bacterium]